MVVHLNINVMSIKSIFCSMFALLFACSCKGEGRVTFESVDQTQFAVEIAKPNVQIVDVRTAAEYEQGHIPGAVNIDVNGADFDSAITTLNKDNTVALYCRSGRRSKIAANKVAAAGYKVVELDGGILSWQGEVVK